MSKLMRITYASRAAFTPCTQIQGIEPHVAKILVDARQHNHYEGICGVLYYEKGYFFQCLEGRELTLRHVFEKIKKDQRHYDLIVLQDEYISQPLFAGMHMKYVAVDHRVKEFMCRYGVDEFNPYTLTHSMLQQFLAMCVQEHRDVQDYIVASICHHHDVLELEREKQRTFHWLLRIGFLTICFVVMSVYGMSILT